MMMQVPQVDPMPLPGPVWLLKTLLLTVFTLHLLAMNCTLGAGLTAGFNALRGRSKQHPFSRRLASELAGMMPIFVAFTVSLGVAALLFVQVLYGNLLYTSSILLGGVWLSVIALVIVGYYGYYYFSMRYEANPRRAAIVALIAFACFLTIAFIFVNNMTLMLMPSRWFGMYKAHPNGWNLNLAENSLIPRYLHVIFGAFAVFSAVVVHLGTHKVKKDREYGLWLIRRAGAIFAILTGVQFFVGTWFLLALPRDVAMVFLRSPVGGAVFGFSLLFALAAMMLMLIAGFVKKPAPLAHSGLLATLITVVLMVVMRDMVRNAYLQPVFRVNELSARPQVSVIILFFIIFLGGLGTLAYMIALVARARPKPAAEKSLAGEAGSL
jgi:MFS family permease